MNTETMGNELENKIDAIVNQNLTDFADAFIHGMTQVKQLYSLVEDVALKFEEWNSTSDYAQQYWRSKRTYCEPKMGGQHIDRIREVRKDLFTYFINNIYNK